MSQIRVVTKPYSGKTRCVLDSLKEFGLKKPFAVEIEIIMNNIQKTVTVFVNERLYKEANYGEMKSEPNDKMQYKTGAELVNVLARGLVEAGFPVKICRKTLDYSKEMESDFD